MPAGDMGSGVPVPRRAVTPQSDMRLDISDSRSGMHRSPSAVTTMEANPSFTASSHTHVEAASPDLGPRSPTYSPPISFQPHLMPRLHAMPPYRPPLANSTYRWMSADAVNAARVRAREEDTPGPSSPPDFDFDFSDTPSDDDTEILPVQGSAPDRPNILNIWTDTDTRDPAPESALYARTTSRPTDRYDQARADVIAMDDLRTRIFLPKHGDPDPLQLAVAVKKCILEQEEDVDVAGQTEGQDIPSSRAPAASYEAISMPYFAQRVLGSPDLPFVAVSHPNHPIYSSSEKPAQQMASDTRGTGSAIHHAVTIYEPTRIPVGPDSSTATYSIESPDETNTAMYDLGQIIFERLMLRCENRNSQQRYHSLKERQAALSQGWDTAALQVVPVATNTEELMLQSLGIFDHPISAPESHNIARDFDTQLIITDQGRDALPAEFGIVILGDNDCPYSFVSVSRGAQGSGQAATDPRKYREVKLPRHKPRRTRLPDCIPY